MNRVEKHVRAPTHNSVAGLIQRIRNWALCSLEGNCNACVRLQIAKYINPITCIQHVCSYPEHQAGRIYDLNFKKNSHISARYPLSLLMVSCHARCTTVIHIWTQNSKEYMTTYICTSSLCSLCVVSSKLHFLPVINTILDCWMVPHSWLRKRFEFQFKLPTVPRHYHQVNALLPRFDTEPNKVDRSWQTLGIKGVYNGGPSSKREPLIFVNNISECNNIY